MSNLNKKNFGEAAAIPDFLPSFLEPHFREAEGIKLFGVLVIFETICWRRIDAEVVS